MQDFTALECAVRQLQARCLDAVWRKDADAFAACFAEDGEWKIAGQHKRGRADIRDFFAALLGRCERVFTLTGAPILHVEGEEATARTYVWEIAKMADGSSATTIGIYFERFVKGPDGLRFAWRHWNLQYRGPADLSAPFFASPDYGPPPGMPSADETTGTTLRQAP